MAGNNFDGVKIFISYAHEDHSWKEQLLDHLGGLVNTGEAEAFSDEQIPAGDEWDPLIRRKLDEADIVVIVLSAKFLRSRFCTQQELRIAMERHGAGAATVIPIVASECDWQALPIRKLQCLPKDERQDIKALEDWGRKKAHALKDVAVRIRNAAEAVRSARPIDLSRYAHAVRKRWDVLDLTALTRPGAEDPSKPRPKLSQLFTPQHARRSRPAVSLPREYLARHGLDSDAESEQLDALRRHWEGAAREPALDLVAREEGRRVVILGDPGAGKSSLARWLVLQLLEPPNEEAPAWRATLGRRVPLLIELRDYIARASDTGCRSFLDYLGYLAEHQGLGFVRPQTEALLSREDSFVLFDGLDEIFDPVARRKVAQEIVGFATRCERARVAVTSRIAGFDVQPFENHEFLIATLDDLDHSQIETFARVWFDLDFADRPSEAEPARRDLLDTLAERPALMALAGNPLLLTLMAIVARHERLARSRVGLYRQALKVLCYSWDLRRELGLPADSPLKDLGPEDKHRLLQKIAWRMQEASEGLRANAIEAADLEAAVDEHFAVEWPTLDRPRRGAAVRDMIGLLEVRNWMVTPRGPALYGFVHRTFLEHLCATELLDRWQQREIETDDLIARYVVARADDDSWHEVIRLLSAQLPVKATEALLQALLPSQSKAYEDAERFLLTVQCAAEQEPRRLAKLEDACSATLSAIYGWITNCTIKTALIDRDKKIGMLLATSFRQIGSHWPNAHLAFAQLGFPTSNQWNAGFVTTVATLFSTVFADTPDLRGLLELEAASNPDADIWGGRIAAMTALATGYSGDARTRQFLLARAEGDPDPRPRATALGLLAQHYRDDPATRALLLARAEGDPDPDARHAALQRLAQHYRDDPATRALLLARAEGDPDPGPRATALGLLAEHYRDDPATRALLLARAEGDPDPGPRATALGLLAEHYRDDPATRALLLARAEGDPDPGPRHAALQRLAQHYRDDPATRALLLARAEGDPDPGPRHAALQRLAEHYRDDPATRALLLARAEGDPDPGPRHAALQRLAEHYRDDPATRALLLARAEGDPDPGVRHAALGLLAEHYRDDPATRALLLARAEGDPDPGPRHAALQRLAEHYRDDPATRALLLARAEGDPDPGPRHAALQRLAEHYRDDPATRALLLARAEGDPDPGPRATALGLLAEHYRDDPATRTLLLASARAQTPVVRRAAALGWGRLLVDDLKQRLLSRDLDGIEPGWDPNEAIDQDRLAAAAKQYSKADAEVRSVYEEIAATFPLQLRWRKSTGPSARRVAHQPSSDP